jgi:hypothetical protein
MASNQSIADRIKSFGTMLAGAEANASDLASQAEHTGELRLSMDGTQEALARQGHYKRLAQEASRDLDQWLARGMEAYWRLRLGVQSQYGPRSEMMAEFGLQPLRPAAKPASKPPKPPVESVKNESANKKPSDTGANPSQTATPKTDSST